MSTSNPDLTDAILGGQNPPPINVVVLGGIDGKKQQLDRLFEGLALKHELFSFETVAVDERGEISTRTNKQAFYYTEQLGNEITLELVYIPAGSFLMGSPPGHRFNWSDGRPHWSCGYPQHLVNLPTFHMSKYPITQSQYQAIVGNNPSGFPGDNRPVEFLTWFDAENFCMKLTRMTGRKYSLPSESQWEYACRSNTTQTYNFGDTITSDLVNYRSFHPFAPKPEGHQGINRDRTTDVGIFPPNAFGLYDMHGNVREWCLDDTNKYTYEGAPNDGSPWFDNNGIKITRGGSWSEDANDCHSAHRALLSPYLKQNSIGFRIVLTAN
jgi:eukaryotic-like serine/threonine-protein kinase